MQYIVCGFVPAKNTVHRIELLRRFYAGHISDSSGCTNDRLRRLWHCFGFVRCNKIDCYGQEQEKTYGRERPSDRR